MIRFVFDRGVLPIGLVALSGLQTPLEEIAQLSKGDVFWNVGIRMQYLRKVKNEINPPSLFYLDVLWGDYQSIGSRRITVDGVLVLTNNMYVGFEAISPRILTPRQKKEPRADAPCDFRLYAAYTISESFFVNTIEKLIPEIFKDRTNKADYVSIENVSSEAKSTQPGVDATSKQ